MYGVRLEVEAHIITGSIASVQNIVHCCQMAGVKVSVYCIRAISFQLRLF